MEEKILLVDDEEGIRKILGISLSDSGYQVYTAENGAQALKIINKERPSVVLSDIKMPVMDGLTLLRKIRSEYPDTEVIMITAHGDMDSAIQSLKLSATDFITKPIDPEILEIALKRAFEKITMRRRLKEYTENLEALVREKSERLVEVERLAAVGQAVEGLSSALQDIAGNLDGGIRYFNEMPCFVAVHNRFLKVVATNELYRKRLGDKVGMDSWNIYPACRHDSDLFEICPVAKPLKPAKDKDAIKTLNISMDQYCRLWCIRLRLEIVMETWTWCLKFQRICLKLRDFRINCAQQSSAINNFLMRLLVISPYRTDL